VHIEKQQQETNIEATKEMGIIQSKLATITSGPHTHNEIIAAGTALPMT
jgi:hypothetical protein